MVPDKSNKYTGINIPYTMPGTNIIFIQEETMKNTDRLVPLEGAFNVRDLGGYKTRQGTTVKWGMVYRAGDLHELTQNDIRIMEERNLRTIIDFRIDDEKIKSPDADFATVVKRVELPINAGNMIDIKKFPANVAGQEIMKELNRVIVRYGTEAYTAFFRALSDRQAAPILFHCSAGKDRTGLGAALFLAALGVERKDIIEDYMLSAEYLRGKYDQLIEEDPYLAPMMTVESGYIEAALDMVETRFGGMELYLKETLGADLELLKNIYTE